MSQKQFNKAFDRVVSHHKNKNTLHGILGHPDGRLEYYTELGVLVPDYVWVTLTVSEDEASAVRVALNKKVTNKYGLPVKLEYIAKNRLEVIEEDADLSSTFGGGLNFNVPTHAYTHLTQGTDPLFVEGRQFLPLSCHPTNPTPDLNVYVEPYYYSYKGVNQYWAGSALDLSSYHAAIGGGYQSFVIVTLNPTTNLLEVFNGTSTTPFEPSTIYVPFSFTDVNAISTGNNLRIAAVRLYSDQTQILWSDIFADLRAYAGGDPTISDMADTYNRRLFLGD